MKTTASGLILIALVSLMALPGRTADLPTTADLLAKYTQALESIRSIHLKTEVTTQYEYEFANDWRDPLMRGVRDQGNKSSRAEYRTDGQCFHSRVYEWGHIGHTHGNVPEGQPYYQCRNWDGKQFYQHTRTVNEPKLPGSINLSEPPAGKYRLWPRNPPVAYLIGYNLASDERIDSILRRARTISVRPKTETVGGSDCYVIDALTDSGRISLWLDPEHGYHPARAETRLAESDVDYDRRLGKGEDRTTRLEKVRFGKVDGFWVPQEADVYLKKDFGGSGNRVSDDYHLKVLEVAINPDHAKCGSFVSPIANPANDPEFRNGTFVYQAGLRTKSLWQDGRVVPDNLGTSPQKKPQAAPPRQPRR